jgi:hypothetical protein
MSGALVLACCSASAEIWECKYSQPPPPEDLVFSRVDSNTITVPRTDGGGGGKMRAFHIIKETPKGIYAEWHDDLPHTYEGDFWFEIIVIGKESHTITDSLGYVRDGELEIKRGHCEVQ